MMILAIVCHSLAFDSRVLRCDLALPYAGAVEKAAIDALDHIIGIPTGTLTDPQRVQLRLPTKHGGLQVDSLVRQCILAHAVALIQRGPNLRTALQRRHPSIDATAHDGIDRAATELLEQTLREHGI